MTTSLQKRNWELWRNGPIWLFHGTLEAHAFSVYSEVLLSKCEYDSDFGRGFYTTTSEQQAERFARKVRDRPDSPAGSKAVLVVFEVSRDELSTLDTLFFVRSNPDAEDFWTLVKSCRLGETNRSNGSYYDVVSGPVALSFQQKLALTDHDQISFHTDKAVKILDNGNKEIRTIV